MSDTSTVKAQNTSYKSVKIYNPIDITIYNLLVGGLEHQFYFSIYWEFHDPNWRTYIFQRAGSTTNQFLTGKRHDISMASGANPFPAGPEYHLAARPTWRSIVKPGIEIENFEATKREIL